MTKFFRRFYKGQISAWFKRKHIPLHPGMDMTRFRSKRRKIRNKAFMMRKRRRR